MNAMVDLLVERQHDAIARPRFRVARTGTYMRPWRSMVTHKGYEVIAWHWENNDERYRAAFHAADYAEALDAVNGYLFTGAAFVHVAWHEDNRRVVETWEAVS